MQRFSQFKVCQHLASADPVPRFYSEFISFIRIGTTLNLRKSAIRLHVLRRRIGSMMTRRSEIHVDAEAFAH